MYFSYILPIRNEETTLQRTVYRISSRLKHFPGSEIILIENGSMDHSRTLVHSLSQVTDLIPIRSDSISQVGMGNAYRRGVQMALDFQAISSDWWIVFSAADLPFGFSDLEAVLSLHNSNPNLDIMVGSKAHPNSKLGRTYSRRMLSELYRILRRLILSMKTRDSQGTLFVCSPALSRLAPCIRAGGYFYSTELIWYAENTRMRIAEVPICPEGEIRPSAVKPIRDGFSMFKEMLQLRQASLNSTNFGQVKARGH